MGFRLINDDYVDDVDDGDGTEDCLLADRFVVWLVGWLEVISAFNIPVPGLRISCFMVKRYSYNINKDYTILIVFLHLVLTFFLGFKAKKKRIVNQNNVKGVQNVKHFITKRPRYE